MASIDLPGDRSGAARARRFVAEQLRAWGADDRTVDDCQLLVSELVTNAVLHARSAPKVTIEIRPDRVRVTVCDESSARPRVREYGPTAVTGRGMLLVDRLSSRWGVEPVVDGKSGKSVWFEVDANLAARGPVASSARVGS